MRHLPIRGREVPVLPAAGLLSPIEAQFKSGIYGSGTDPSLSLNFLSGEADGRLNFSRASSATYFDQTGTLQTAAANVPRFNHDPVTLAPLGLLIEPQSTNSITNSTAQGGAPGVSPTWWSTGITAFGITITVVDVGVQNGLNYIDVNYSGTATNGYAPLIQAVTNTQVSAVSGQSWSSSFFATVVAGSLNGAACGHVISERNSTGGSVFDDNTPITPVFGPLVANRYLKTRTLTGSTTTYVISFFKIIFTSGNTYNVTIRFSQPQLEQFAFPTSPILTSNAAVTRAGDYCTMPVGPWYSSAAGTLLVEAAALGTLTSETNFASIDDNSLNNRLSLRHDINGYTTSLVEVNGTTTYISSPVLLTSGSPFRFATAVGGGTATTYFNSASIGAALINNPSLASAVTTLNIGTGNTGPAAAYIRSVAFWPRALSTVELAYYTGPVSYWDTLRDYNFLTGVLPDDITLSFSRASTATYFDNTGTLQTAAADTPRFDFSPVTLLLNGLLIEPQTVNSIRNNTMAGAVSGVYQSGGVLPTYWTAAQGNGVALSIVGTGTEDGIPYIDLNWSGTPTSSSISFVVIDTGIAAFPNQAWTHSTYFRVVGGSFANATVTLQCEDYNSSGGNVGQSIITISNSVTGAPLATQRQTVSHTAGANTVYEYPTIVVSFTNALPINLTLRVGAPQLEQWGVGTSVILTNGSAVTRAADTATVSALPFFNQGSNGSIEAEFIVANGTPAGESYGIASISDGTDNNQYRLRMPASDSTVLAEDITVGGSAITNMGLVTGIAIGKVNKGVFAWTTSTTAGSVNGGTVASGSITGSLPTGMTTLVFGNWGNSADAAQLCGWMRRLRYWGRTLTNTELQQVTT